MNQIKKKSVVGSLLSGGYDNDLEPSDGSFFFLDDEHDKHGRRLTSSSSGYSSRFSFSPNNHRLSQVS